MAISQTTVPYSSFSAASRRLIDASGTPDTKTYHAQINKRIEELEQEVCRIYAEISALKTCRNAVSKTARLPIEILTRVFYFVSKFHTCTDILHVSHVCRHWRSIVLDHRQFFGDLQGRIVTEERLTETMIRMSGKGPLTYSWTGSKSFYGQPLNIDALNEVVYYGVGRLKSFVCWRGRGDRFEITNPDKDYREESELNLAGPFVHWFEEDSNARMLEKLSVVNIIDDNYFEETKDLPDKSDLKKGHITPEDWSGYMGNRLLTGAPVLRDLTLSHVGLKWKQLPLVPTLVHLRLLEDSRFNDMFRPMTPDFMASIEGMPQLETLELHNFLPSPETPHVGRTFTFPSALKTLKITDDEEYLSHFLQMAHILDHTSIEAALFQDEIGEDDIGDFLTNLKNAVGKNRANAGVKKLEDRSGFCFKLSYGGVDLPERGRASEEGGRFGSVTVHCGLGWVNGLTPEEYHSILAQHFDFSCLQLLHFGSTDKDKYNEVWELYDRLPKLDALVLDGPHFGSFIDYLEPDEEPTGHDHQSLRPFPALKQITAIPPPKPKAVPRVWGARQTKAKSEPTALQAQDGSDCTSRFIDILNARKELGLGPLQSVAFAEREVSQEVAELLQKSLPGLTVSRFASED